MTAAREARKLLRKWNACERLHYQRMFVVSWSSFTHVCTNYPFCCSHFRFDGYQTVYAGVLRQRAQCFLELQQLLSEKTRNLKADRTDALRYMVEQANTAATFGNHRQLYSIVKKLKGEKPKPLMALKSESGEILSDLCDIEQRWVRHHANVLSADIVRNLELVCTNVAPKFSYTVLEPSVDDIFTQSTC